MTELHNLTDKGKTQTKPNLTEQVQRIHMTRLKYDRVAGAKNRNTEIRRTNKEYT